MSPKRQNPSHWQPGKPPGPGRPKGRLNSRTIEIRDFARNLFGGLFRDKQYVYALKDRIRRGKESPAVIGLLLAYGFGRPPEKIVIQDPAGQTSAERRDTLIKELVGRIVRNAPTQSDVQPEPE